jgi:glycosyltransferase involved in cell wall biosynthesis
MTAAIYKSMDSKGKQINLGIVAMPLSKSGITPLSNLIAVTYPTVGNISLITGKEAYDHFKNDERIQTSDFYVRKPTSLANNFAVRALRCICLQIKASYRLARVGSRADAWIFFLGADLLPLAVLTAKILGKKTLLLQAANYMHSSIAESGFPKITSPLFKASRLLSDRIILYSDLIEEWNFERYRKKIIIAHRHFLNFSEFVFRDNLEQRNNLVGFVGRLEPQKAILNFVEAMPRTLAKRPDVKFLIIGEGKLEDDVCALLDEHRLNSKVKRFGWIPHNELPDWLASLKLLILPSSHEGLPNIMLEAMACGTPVLASAVDAIPDVIKDGETGFLLSDNSPACIAEGIVATLSYPNLRQVAINARNLVESEFCYENVVKMWAALLRNTLER